jgi:hypothetical protein
MSVAGRVEHCVGIMRYRASNQTERAEHVVRVGRTVCRNHAVENDRSRLLDREFRPFDEIREISLEERLSNFPEVAPNEGGGVLGAIRGIETRA